MGRVRALHVALPYIRRHSCRFLFESVCVSGEARQFIWFASENWIISDGHILIYLVKVSSPYSELLYLAS